MTMHEVDPDRCPYCHREVDAATALDPGANPPVPGDVTMCWFCGHWSTWYPNGRLGPLSNEQLVAVMTRPECVAVSVAWQQEHTLRDLP